MFIIGAGAVLGSEIWGLADNVLGAAGIVLLLGSLCVAIWPNVPRLRITTEAFGVRGFFGRGLAFDKYPWDTLVAIEPDDTSLDAGFVIVTTKGRVRIRRNTAGLSEVRRLFEMIARNPENVEAILENEYCDDESPILLRKNWQNGIGPALLIPGTILLGLNGAGNGTLFGFLFLGAAGGLCVVYMFQFLRNPYTVRVEGTMLSMTGIFQKRQWDLTDIFAMDVPYGADSEWVRIQRSEGKVVNLRLKDFLGSPSFDRAFYPIYCRWNKAAAVSGKQ